MGDYSLNYVNNTKSMIYFAFGNKQTSFKPFVESFSYSYSNNIDKTDGTIYNKTITVDNFKSVQFSLSLNVVAANVNESIENHKNYQILLRMMMPERGRLGFAKILFMKFSNLISKNGQTGKNNMSIDSIISEGFQGVIKDLKYEPDMDMGFFEYNGMLFSKAFKMNIEIFAIPNQNVNIIPAFKSGFSYKTGSQTRTIQELENAIQEEQRQHAHMWS